MKGVAITHPGLEAVSGKEVKELIGADPIVSKSVALFETGNVQDFCTLCYKMQSAFKILTLESFGDVDETGIEGVLPKIDEVDLAPWLVNKTFAVRSKIINNDDCETLETERAVGEVIHDKYSEKLSAKVDLKNPDVTFFIYIFESKFYFGIDFAGIDLSKRSYRVFGLNDSIKGTVAYSLLRIAGYKPDKVLVDPFSHSATIAIEAAFYGSNKPIRFYEKDSFAFHNFPQFEGFDFDKFFEDHDKSDDVKLSITASDSQQRNLKSAEKNAKIAGVNKSIKFTRMDIEWLDTKFEKQSVDLIVSNPPRVSRQLNEKGLEKVFQEFFYTADFILKPDGKVVMLANNYNKILNYASRHNFDLKAKFETAQGQEVIHILVFGKK